MNDTVKKWRKYEYNITYLHEHYYPFVIPQHSEEIPFKFILWDFGYLFLIIATKRDPYGMTHIIWKYRNEIVRYFWQKKYYLI